jgi:Lhr-like helicase
LIDEIKREKKEFAKSKKLVRITQERYMHLLKSIGDEKAVQVEAKEILKLVKKIQKTAVYEFIKDDVIFFKGKVMYIMQHPKEHKLTYVLASVYLVAPGTFEITFAILFVRYLTKYAVKKIKR